jgi:hypothetical protein
MHFWGAGKNKNKVPQRRDAECGEKEQRKTERLGPGINCDVPKYEPTDATLKGSSTSSKDSAKSFICNTYTTDRNKSFICIYIANWGGG